MSDVPNEQLTQHAASVRRPLADVGGLNTRLDLRGHSTQLEINTCGGWMLVATDSGLGGLNALEKSPINAPSAPIVSAHMCKRRSPCSMRSCGQAMYEHSTLSRGGFILTRVSGGVTESIFLKERTRSDTSTNNAYPADCARRC